MLSSVTDIATPPRAQSAGSSFAYPGDEDKSLHRVMASSLSEMENVGQHQVNSPGSKKKRGSIRRARKRTPGTNEETGASLVHPSMAIRAKSPGGGDNKEEDKSAEGTKAGGSIGMPRRQLVRENDTALHDIRYVFPEIVPARRERDSVMCNIL